MAHKKQKSKRITTRKREKIAKKVREFHKKERKIQREKAKKVPRSVLLTKDEKEYLNQIKQQTEERCSKIIQETVADELPKYLQEMKDKLNYDYFVQMVDYRDISGSRDTGAEALLADNNKIVYTMFTNTDLTNKSNTTPTVNILSDDIIRSFKPGNKIVIFGNKKSGKFSLQKYIEQLLGLDTIGKEVVLIDRITTPTESNTPSALFRNAVDLQKVDSIFLFSQVFMYLNPVALKDHFMIDDFASVDEFLLKMGKKFSKENKDRRIKEAGAARFFKDVINKNIHWRRDGHEYAFFQAELLN